VSLFPVYEITAALKAIQIKEIPIKQTKSRRKQNPTFPSVGKNDGMALSSAIMGIISPGES
jgi:hypothetical protein